MKNFIFGYILLHAILCISDCKAQLIDSDRSVLDNNNLPGFIKEKKPEVSNPYIQSHFKFRSCLWLKTGIDRPATICSSWPGEFQDLRWTTNVDPTPFIRNEELILLYAEANWLASGGDKSESIRALNNVRNTWGVGDTPITTGSTDDEFIEELLVQRRFSLWAETGHRWVDLRRFNRLDDTHIDLRDCGTIYTQVDRRTSEQTWEDSNN